MRKNTVKYEISDTVLPMREVFAEKSITLTHLLNRHINMCVNQHGLHCSATIEHAHMCISFGHMNLCRLIRSTAFCEGVQPNERGATSNCSRDP